MYILGDVNIVFLASFGLGDFGMALEVNRYPTKEMEKYLPL
jgi:hypothetical protein